MSIEKKMMEWFTEESQRLGLINRTVPIEMVFNKLFEVLDEEFDKIEKFIKEKLGEEGGEKE